MAEHPHDDAAPPGGRLMLAMGAVRTVLDRALQVLCIALFVLLVAVVTWQVFTRLVLNNPAGWTEEAARYVFVTLAILGAALMFSERGHIAVEIVAHRLRPRGQKILAVAIQLIIGFFAVYVFIIGGARVSDNSWNQQLASLPFTVGQMALVMPFAGVLIALSSLHHLLAAALGAEEPIATADEAAEEV